MRPFARSVLLILVVVVIGLLAGWSIDARAQSPRPILVLDPGHGLNNGAGLIDPGEVSGDLVEKEITLDVARQARDILSRCEVDVYLTHDRDDYNHTENDIADIVNGFNPTLAISIHTNSSNNPSTSGTQTWFTVGGYDDASSQTLASTLATEIANPFAIPDLGALPETQSPSGGLTIHDWEAPSALLELAFLQADAELLRNERRNFARAIARALLSDVNVPLDCADHASAEGFAIAVYFPEEERTNAVTLLNDGLLAWNPGEYTLVNTQNPLGAPESLPLPHVVQAGEMVTWDAIPARAPESAGIYRQKWQLYKGETPLGDEATVVAIVVPQQAVALKEEIESKIDELRQQGQQHLEEQLEQLRQQIMDAVEQKLTEWLTDAIHNICGGNSAVVALAFGAVVLKLRKKRRVKE
jgi:N-acetylmuramoyl-L-alanine amidase/DNA-binding transcriptional MerR regulator